MKSLILSFIFTFPIFALAAQSEAIKVVRVANIEEVWGEVPGQTALAKIGEVEVLKKGTRLYHWGKATPEQAVAWNDAGRVSPKVLEQAMKARGAVGGGFYVSKVPFDSANYGNTLVVIELPEDIRIVRALMQTANWSQISNKLLQAGFSGVGHPMTNTWMTIIDEKALTKEFVASESFWNSLKSDWVFSPRELVEFKMNQPGLAAMPWYKESEKRAKDVSANMKKGGELGAQALNQMAYNSTSQYMVEAAITADLYGMTEQFLASCGNHFNCLRAIFSRLNMKHPIHESLIAEALKSRDQEVLKKAIWSIEALNPLSDATRTLQNAQKFWGADLPAQISEYIETRKKRNLWHPHMFCSQVFGGL